MLRQNLKKEQIFICSDVHFICNSEKLETNYHWRGEGLNKLYVLFNNYNTL